MKQLKLKVRGMTCSSCEKIIQNALLELPGVTSAKASLQHGEVYVFMEDNADEKVVYSAIKDAGYETGQDKGFIALALGLVAVLVALYFLTGDSATVFSPESDASFVALFLLGVLTGFHCVGMCGGFILSYTLSGKNSLLHHLSYNGGKLLSYTIIGAIFGLVGSVIAFTPEMRAAAAFLAGLFLILYGVGMLGILPRFTAVRFQTPLFLQKITAKIQGKGPAAIGLANGLMLACGPLQAMYIFAAATGDALAGATALFAFGLGTLPAMLVLGVVGSAVGMNSLKKYVRYAGVLVIFLGFLMFNNGLALSGTALLAPSSAQVSVEAISADACELDSELCDDSQKPEYQEIHMDVTKYGYEPNSFVLQKGVLVRWIINGKELSYCNNGIVVPEYGLEFSIEPGEQVIEFTPENEGTFGWSCWMGMIPGSFTVVDSDITEEEIEKITVAALPKAEAGCGGSCGGTCGGGCSGTCGG